MIAKIEERENEYAAIFVREYHHSVASVWSWLTNNEKLAKWFSELSVAELKKGGVMKFDMGDGTFEEMEIIAVTPYKELAFMWGEERVHFYLKQEKDKCILTFVEKLTNVTPHTPKDLAGWHVCLDVIGELLDGRTVHNRKELWEGWYEKYKQALADYQA